MRQAMRIAGWLPVRMTGRRAKRAKRYWKQPKALALGCLMYDPLLRRPRERDT